MISYRSISELLNKQAVFLGPAAVKLVVKSLNIKTANDFEVVEIADSENDVLRSLADKFEDLAGPAARKPIEQFLH